MKFIVTSLLVCSLAITSCGRETVATLRDGELPPLKEYSKIERENNRYVGAVVGSNGVATKVELSRGTTHQEYSNYVEGYRTTNTGYRSFALLKIEGFSTASWGDVMHCNSLALLETGSCWAKKTRTRTFFKDDYSAMVLEGRVATRTEVKKQISDLVKKLGYNGGYDLETLGLAAERQSDGRVTGILYGMYTIWTNNGGNSKSVSLGTVLLQDIGALEGVEHVNSDTIRFDAFEWEIVRKENTTSYPIRIRNPAN